VLSGELPLSAVTHATQVAHLSVVPAGPVVPNPAALLSEGGLETMLQAAKQEFEFVVIDGPPVMGLADAPLMGSVAEAAVLVVEASEVHRATVLTAVARLQAAKTRLIGAVLNKFESRKSSYGYGYSYSYSYGSEAVGEQDGDERKIILVK
jgi:capsular exopolysaccharide synthesis family protein